MAKKKAAKPVERKTKKSPKKSRVNPGARGATAKSRQKAKVYTIAEVAAKEGVSVAAVQAWINSSKIKAVQDKQSKVWLIPVKTYKRPPGRKVA